MVKLFSKLSVQLNTRITGLLFCYRKLVRVQQLLDMPHKHLLFLITDRVRSMKLKIKYCSTGEMLADHFTDLSRVRYFTSFKPDYEHGFMSD